MTKRILKVFLSILMISALTVCFAACSNETNNPSGNENNGPNNPDDGNNNTNAGEDHVHTEEDIPATEPTCTTPGMSVGKKCRECGEILVQPTVTAEALGHDKQFHAGSPASCNKIGWDDYETCSRCDYSTYREYYEQHNFKVLPSGARKCLDCGEVFTPVKPLSTSKKRT